MANYGRQWARHPIRSAILANKWDVIKCPNGHPVYLALKDVCMADWIEGRRGLMPLGERSESPTHCGKCEAYIFSYDASADRWFVSNVQKTTDSSKKSIIYGISIQVSRCD